MCGFKCDGQSRGGVQVAGGGGAAGAKDLLRHKAIKALVVETDERRFARDLENMKTHGYAARSWGGVLIQSVKKGFYGNVLVVPEGS